MRRFFPLLFLATLAFPAAMQILAPQWSTDLGGVTKKSKLPSLSWQDISKGAFQHRFEKWFMRKLGVRPLLIKTDNQINYELFSQLSSSQKGKAILGRKGHLIEKIYAKRGQGALAPKKRRLQEKAHELTRLQKVLATRNIPLLLLISPNKPSLYPEIVPWEYQVPKGLKADYQPLQYFTTLLKEASVPVIVSKEVLEKKKQDFAYPFFAHTGTHWSELGSCLIAEELFSTIRKLLPSFTGALTCTTDGARKFPLPIDRDLLSVANLWTPNRLVYPEAKVVRQVQRSTFSPSPLFVGTSFLWALFYNIDKTHLLSQRDMYYYFKRSVPHPQGKEEPIKKDDPKWIDLAMTHDIVILEVNEAFLHRVGYGFPKRLLRQLALHDKAHPKRKKALHKSL